MQQPQQLGKYVLEELIAVGGMAEIYRGHTAALGGVEKVLAIKRLHPQYCSDGDFVDMLVDEARIAMQLNHKNIGQVFDLERSDDSYFLAMEYIHGRDLHRVLRRFAEKSQLMPLEGACYVASEICSGLSYAHRRTDNQGQPLNIIHRDVSPQNVLISFEGEVKIVDFGIAKAARRASFTQRGVIKGKFYYMSPEQARGDRVDQRTDIFSVGAILYEMVTGRMLYEGDEEARLVQRARMADYPPPSTYAPDLPPQLEQIILKALARDLRQRFQTARNLQLALTNFSRSMGWVYDSVMLSDQMHALFDASNQTSGILPVPPPKLMERPDYQPSDDSVIGRYPSPPPNVDPYEATADTGANVDEDAPTEVFGNNEIPQIVEQLDSHYGRDDGSARRGPSRAAVPAARRVDIDMDDGARREATAIGRRDQIMGQRRSRSGPPPLMIAMGVAGIALLIGAFVFATTQLLSDDEEEAASPRLRDGGAAAATTGFNIHSEPAGARIFIDGEDSGLFTPASVTGLTDGVHEISLKLPHHEEIAQRVVVERGGEWSATLEPRRGILKIDTTPAGATIHVDGERVGTAPINVDDLTMSEAHTVAASLDGYKNGVRTVRWLDDEPILKVKIALLPIDSRAADVAQALMDGAWANVIGTLAEAAASTRVESPTTTAAATQSDASTAKKKKKRSRRRKKTRRRSSRRRDKDDDRRSSSASKGKVSVASKPPGIVYIDGKSIRRKTPLRGHRVKSGYHKFKVKYSDGSFSGEKRALIKPGAEIKLFFRQ